MVKISMGIECHTGKNIEAVTDSTGGIQDALAPRSSGTGTKLENGVTYQGGDTSASRFG